MTTRKPKDPERVTIQTYKNKKGDERVGVQFARSLGLKLAVNDEEAIEKLVEAIAARIIKEERSAANSDG